MKEKGKNCKRFPTRPESSCIAALFPLNVKCSQISAAALPVCDAYTKYERKNRAGGCVRIVIHRSVRKSKIQKKKTQVLATLKPMIQRKCLGYYIIDSLYEVDRSCCVPVAQSMQNAECPSVSMPLKFDSEALIKIDACAHDGRFCPSSSTPMR